MLSSSTLGLGLEPNQHSSRKEWRRRGKGRKVGVRVALPGDRAISLAGAFGKEFETHCLFWSHWNIIVSEGDTVRKGGIPVHK